MTTLQVLGFYDTDGGYLKSATGPIDVTDVSGRLYDTDGMCWAVRDQYNDWVSPTMLNLGKKARIEVKECP